MIKFESGPEGQEILIYLDDVGIQDLTAILAALLGKTDHTHLNIGHHLDDSMPEDGYKNVQHVKIISNVEL